MLNLFAFRPFKAPSPAIGEKQIAVLFPKDKIEASLVMSAKRRHDRSDVGTHSVESTFVR